MGNNHSHSGNNKLHGEARILSLKFDTDEIHVLRKTWQDLADRTNGKGIDKETFLQYFPLNGLLGERMFAQFDTKETGYIDFDGFISGLAKVCRGTLDDKIHFVFNMYDVSHDNTVSKQDLTTLLNQIPKEALHDPNSFYQNQDLYPRGQLTSQNSVASYSLNLNNESENGSLPAEETYQLRDHDDDLEDFDTYTNHDLVEKAFAECDLNHEGRLTYEQFKMWVERTPMIMNYIESILPYNGPKDIQPHSHKAESLPHMKRIASRSSFNGRANSMQDPEFFNGGSSRRTNIRNRTASTGGIVNLSQLNTHSNDGQHSPSPMSPMNHNSAAHAILHQNSNAGLPLSRNSSFSMAGQPLVTRQSHAASVGGESVFDTEEAARSYLIQAMEVTQNEQLKLAINNLLEHTPGGAVIMANSNDSDIYRSMVSVESYLWKKGKSIFHALTKRYYLLSGNCVYYYTHKSDVRPKGVVFLMGSIIEKIKDDDMELKGYYGFELLHQDLCSGEHHRHEKRILYCKGADDREKWVSALQHAAHVVPIEDDYVLGKELGRGRFSVVCECVHKITNKHCAVKIIDKATIEPEEKELLRTEIAVLKLVNHPNIIRLEGLYESKKFIYIVMEMLKGGELFERIVGRPRFTELEAARLLRPLLESVAYLHDLGIVHRDLKPENILCGEQLEDLKIADFGLSKMILPKEKMDSACGTLSYVAPEVLTMQGYGKEADLWSVGVIMFLLLCGKLPFDGEDHNEIIRSTIQADLKVNPSIWSKLSDDARGLMTSLLNKSPKDRISAREALRHPFITTHNPSHRRNSMSHVERDHSVNGGGSVSGGSTPPPTDMNFSYSGFENGIASKERERPPKIPISPMNTGHVNGKPPNNTEMSLSHPDTAQMAGVPR